MTAQSNTVPDAGDDTAKEATTVKTHLPDPEAATDALVPVPVQAELTYPAWLDGFDHQIQALVQLARQGNRVAYNMLCDLHAKYSTGSDHASQVAGILEQVAAR